MESQKFLPSVCIVPCKHKGSNDPLILDEVESYDKFPICRKKFSKSGLRTAYSLISTS